MKNNFRNFFGLAVILCVALGCSLMNKIKGEMDKGSSPQVIQSTDRSYEITVPGNWATRTDLNSEATLQAANTFDESYVIVIQENKGDFPVTTTIDTITDLVRDNARSAVLNAEMTEPVSTTINGYTARQFEVAGKVSGVGAKYIYGIVETRGSYYQIMTWTLADRFAKNKDKLTSVINSFKETGGASTTTTTTNSSNSSKFPPKK